MSKTIQQLATQAAQIEEATRQGENTALRVGGLFTDIVEYLETLHLNDVSLGPLLTALNNSDLIDPSDGQTLTFSIMKDGWKFSDALTQLKLSQRGIEQTVTTNYEAFLRIKGELEADVDETDRKVREYRAEYDQDQIEYATWKSQTSTSISQFAAAFTVDGRMVSMSEMVQTAYDISTQVTNDKSAADAAFAKLFDLAGMSLTDDKTASWIYQNREGIYAATATFDSNGNIKSGSKLAATINSIYASIETIGGEVGDMGLYVKKSELGKDIVEAHLSANVLSFNFTDEWVVSSNGKTVMRLDRNGNLTITGTINANLNYYSMKTIDGSYTINPEVDLCNIYCLSGGSITAPQEITLPSPSTYKGLELTFFCEYKMHTRSWYPPVLNGTIYSPTEDNYGNVVNSLTVESGHVYRLIAAGGAWALM